MSFGCLMLGVSPVAGWPCAIREQSSAACFCPRCRGVLRFFARVLRSVYAPKPRRGLGFVAAGCARLCGCLRLHRDGRGVTSSVCARAQVGRQSAGLHACYFLSEITRSSNRACFQCDLCSNGAADTRQAGVLFKTRASLLMNAAI